jgi:DNA mismatch repair protein MutL
MPIRQLPQSLVNMIAAGEVVERPASVVKELMENALDAGATRVDVAVEQGGVELVRVVDNGRGIPPAELPLAVAAHATSKLAEPDDLFRIGTLGFRGEALASIAEVSRLLLRSRTPEGLGGAEIRVDGGRAGEAAPCGCPVGTQVEVRNLFFNTPVRKKFLRTTPTELGHVSEAFTRIALAAPNVHFTLRHNDRPVFEQPAGEGWRERIARLFGRELADALIWVEGSDGQVRLSGYVAHPAHSRTHNRMQYFFLNGRHIRDRSLQHALGEAYRGLLTTGRYPIAFLAIDMPPEMVDVNVHPTKLEVRFQDSGRLYAQLLSALRNKFLTVDLNTRIGPQAGDSATSPGPTPADRAVESQMRQQVVDWAKGQMASWEDDDRRSAGATPTAGGDSAEPAARGPLELTRLGPAWRPVRHDGLQGPGAPPASEHEGHAHAAGPQAAPPARHDAPRTSALQVHNRYLVTETSEGVTIIDQHALHERILYEHLRERIASGPVEAQSLLVPEPVDLAPAEAAAALENRDLLARLGMKIEPFGGETVLISGFPAMLANLNPVEVLRDLVARLLEGGRPPDQRDLLDELLHGIACKAAIKAGDRLTAAEIEALLEQRHLVDDAHHCPHGRPTALVFTREELDKRFKRI